MPQPLPRSDYLKSVAVGLFDNFLGADPAWQRIRIHLVFVLSFPSPATSISLALWASSSTLPFYVTVFAFEYFKQKNKDHIRFGNIATEIFPDAVGLDRLLP